VRQGRVNFATALAQGKLPLGTEPAASDQMPAINASAETAPVAVDAAALENLLGAALSARTRAAMSAAPAELRAPLLLGGPDFMRR